MEPTEVVDSLRGLVAVADNAFRSTYDFAKDKIDPFMDVKRRDEIRRVATEIQDLAGLLHRLTLVATTFDVEYSRAFDDHHGVRLPKLPQQLFACRHTLIRLQATLSRRKLKYDIGNKEEDFRGRAKLRWPFTTAWTVDLMEEIGRHKEAITKALTSNSMNELLGNFSDAKDQHLPRFRDAIRRYMMGRCGYSMEKSAMTRFFLRLGHLEFLMQTLSHRSRWTEYELLEREPVRSWIAGSSNNNKSHHLWIKGGPGVGKTTFAATLIETAIHTHYSDKTTAVAFIFCRFSNPRTHDCFYLLSTLLAQVAVQHPSAMSVLEKYYGELSGRRLVEMPTIERMMPVFRAIAKVFRQILLVIDGAEECPDHGDVVTQLMASIVSQSDNVRLAVVSDHQGRMEAAFKKTFGESLHCQEYEPSVRHLETFAATELEKIMVEGNTVFNNPRLKDKAIQKVASIDDPNFQLTSCSIQYIARYATAETLEDISNTLPRNLGGIYKLILQRCNEQPASTQALIQSVLHLTAFSDAPLTDRELCQALSVAGIPGLDADMFEYPEVDENEIMDKCGIFLARSTDREGFELAHHTIKEFLEQLDPTDEEFAGYRLSTTRTRRLVGLCALRFLCLNHFSRFPKRLNSEDGFISNRLRRLPFYRYAALVWPRLADELWDDEEFRQQAMELCNPTQTPNFKSWSLEVCHFYRLGGSWSGWVNDRYETWGVGSHYWSHGWHSESDSLCSESTEACTGPSGSHWGTSDSSISEGKGKEVEIIEESRSWYWWRRQHIDRKWKEGQTRRLVHFIRRGNFTPLHMACILGLQRLCDDLLANRADVNLMSRIGTPLQCALGGPFLIACHDLSTRKTYSKLWNKVSTVEKTSTELTQVLIEAGADCTRPLPTHYTWDSVGALGLKSSEWAMDYQIFSKVVKGGAEMHDDAIHTFRLQCREWTKYKNERARSNVATILEVLQDMVLEGVDGASAYLTAFRSVVTDTHGINSPLPALEVVTDCMFIGKMKKAIEEDSLSALREIAESPRGQPLFQDDMLDDLLDDAVSHSAINCLSFLLARLSGSEAEEEKKGRLVLRCTHNAMEDVLLCLLRHGSKTTSTDSEGRNVWHLSTMGASSARIPRVLVLHAAADDRKIALHAQENCDGRTPLANALCKGDYEGVNIILQYCQADEAAFQSTEPSVNNIISGIKSPEVLQRLHEGGFLPKPTDETPLHALPPNCEIDGLRKLLEIYPYKDSLSLKSPVGCYFAATSFLCYKKDVLELLISTELPLSLNPHQRSIWSMVFDKLDYNLTHNNLVMAQIRWAPPLVDLLINTGCLAAHEAVSGVSALKEVESLLSRNIPINPRFRSSVIIPLEDIFVSVVNATADHPHLKSTELDIALLRWAVVRDSIDLVKLLLELGTSVHARGDNGNELSALELVCHHGPHQCSGGTLRKILEKSNKGALNNLHPYGDGDHVGLLHLHGHCNGLRTPNFYFAVILKWPQLGPPPPPPPPGTPVLLDTGGFARFRKPIPTSSVTLLRMLLDEGCDPNILSQPGNKSPLLTHIVGQDMDSVQLLLQRGGATTVNTSDSSGWTPVSWACAYGWTFLLNDMVVMADTQRIWDFEVAVWLHQHGSTPWKFKQAKALHIATIGSAETVAYLLNGRYVTEIDATTSNGTTPLHFATILGQIDSIRLLVSRGANIDAQNQNGSTPLHMAIKTKNITVIELLLSLGSKHLKNRQGQAPLDLAVAQNDRTITEILRDSIRGPSGTKDGTACNDKHSISAMRGAIQGAIERDDHDTVKRLLDEGCSPDIKMRPCRICPALLYALGRRPVSKRCVQLLIDQGASFKGMTCRQHQNWRRWHWPRSWPEGAESGASSDSYSVTTSSETSSSSLECGRGQEWPFRGSTALDYFMEVSELEQNLETYLQAIPQLELKWLTQNSSPAYVSFDNKSHKPLEIFLRHLQLMNSSLGRSLTKRVVTQVINRDENTPLHMAASHKNATMAKLVIKYGADVNAKNSSGSTPLHLAASSNDVAVIEALLDEGASMELRNGRGCTALQVAVGDNRIRAATVLLDRGAQIDAIGDQNMFIFLGRMNTFRMLLNAGMSINHRGALSLPLWASALFNVRTATFILNSDFASGIEVEPHKTALWRVWWNTQLVDEGSSQRCLPLFHRRLGFTFLRKLGEIENTTVEGDNFSLLCLACHYGRVEEVKDLLRLGLNIEFEGSAAGTALMVAAHEGRMDVVKLLVSHGARIQYKRGGTWISALDAGRTFPDVVEWLLVGRFTEQGKLEIPPESRSDALAFETRPWSGVRQGIFLLEGAFQRRGNQSSIRWLQCLEKVKRRMRGTVAVSGLWMPEPNGDTSGTSQ